MRRESERKDDIIVQMSQINEALAARVLLALPAPETRDVPEMAVKDLDGDRRTPTGSEEALRALLRGCIGSSSGPARYMGNLEQHSVAMCR